MARILITIPTWNESKIIERTLATVQEAVKKYLPEHEVMIEVADNGSTDGTVEISGRGDACVAHSVLQLSHKGKGLAIRTSWEKHLNDADILIFTDADLAADLSVLPQLIAPLLNKTVDITCGSRFVPGAVCKRRFRRELASRVYRFLQKIVLCLPVLDAQCGLKAITAEAANKVLPLCKETHWMFDSELLAISTKKGLKIEEIPVQWQEQRTPGRRSALRLLRDGWGFLLGLARIRVAL